VISVLCPTRNRPDSVRRLINSGLDTAYGPVEFIFYCDLDAPLPKDVTERPEVKVINGERITLSQMWNECQKLATADVFMQCGDDVVFRTKNWDKRILDTFEEYPDKVAFVFCNAKDWGDKLGTHGFLHRKWVETVGYFTPPHFTSDFGDKWIDELGRLVGRRVYLSDVVTEHMHPIWGKSSWDATYTERLNRHSGENLDALYESLAGQRLADAERLKAVMSK
jgi:Glycosyl transferase family 2